MPIPNLPWNCPNPYCQEPHNESSIAVKGVVRCQSCGWERKVRAPEPENLDEWDNLFTPIAPPKTDKPDKP